MKFKSLTGIILSSCFLAMNLYSQNTSDRSILKTIDSGIEQALNLAREGRVEDSNAKFRILLIQGQKELGEQHEKIALLLHKWGVALYLNDHYEASIQKYGSALEIRSGLYGEQHIDIARGHHNIGVNHKYLSDFNKAESSFLKAIDIWKSLDQEENLAYSYQELGEVFELKGDYEQAINYYELAVSIFEIIYGPDDIDVAYLYLLIGSTFEQTNNFENARTNLEKALAIFENIGFKEGKALANNELGILYQRQSEEFDKALFYFRNCKGLYDGMEELPPAAMADLFNNLGIVYGKMLDFDNALANLDSAISLYNKTIGLNNPKAAGAYDNIGNIYQQKADYNKAVESYQKAFNALLSKPLKESGGKNPHLEDLKHVQSKPVIFEIISDKSIALLKQSEETGNIDQLENVLDNFMLADSFINVLHREYSAEGSKLHWVKKTRETYTNAIKTCRLLSRKTNLDRYDTLAFFFAEKSKAVLLLEGFREIEAKGFAQIPDELLLQEKKFKSMIVSIQRDISSEKNQLDIETLTALKDSLLQAERRLSAFAKNLERNYPKYFRFKYETSVASVREVQQELDNKTAVIEYFIDKEFSCFFVITKNGLEIGQLPSIEELPGQVELFRKTLSDKSFFENNYNEALQQFNNSGFVIYSKFVEQTLKRLPPSIKRIIVVPDGPLSFVPFECIPDGAENPQEDFFSNTFLLQRFIINYSYSSTLFLDNISRSESLSSNLNLLAFAPDYSNNPELHNLPGLKTEIEKVQALYHDPLSFFNGDATKANFFKRFSEFDIIHLAMHGIVDQQEDNKSRLSFSLDKDSNGIGSDLYAYEIPSLDLQARLVVLSACETGVGKYVKGEGVMSLARNFMFAGTPSIVMSLWQTNDLATQQIMSEFHEKILNGVEKDEALRIAKLNYIANPVDENAHPFYWAPFVSIGDYHPVVKKNKSPVIFMITGLIIVLVFGFTIYTRRSMKLS